MNVDFNNYNHVINEYNVKLNLLNSFNLQIDTSGKISRKCEGEVLSRTAFLSQIFSNVNQTRVFYFDREQSNKLLDNVKKYATAADGEKAQALKITKKIESVIEKKRKAASFCSFGEGAKEINKILDLEPSKLSQKDYDLLYDLANALAQARYAAYSFHYQVSILKLIQKYKKQCPNATFTREGDTVTPSLKFYHSTDDNDCLLALKIELFCQQNPKLDKVNPELIKTIVKREKTSSDLDFKDYLKQRMKLHIIFGLMDKWEDVIDSIHGNAGFFNLDLKTDVKTLNKFTMHFIREPKNYVEIRQSFEPHPFDYSGRYGKAAEDVKSSYRADGPELDIWYRAIYEKLSEGQKNHSSVSLPYMTPETYSSHIEFIEPEDILIPFEIEFNKWDEEFKKETNKENQLVKSSNTPKGSAGRKKKKNPPQRKFKVEYIEDEIELPVATSEVEKPEKNSPSLDCKEKITNVENQNLQVDKKPSVDIHQLLVESSPFAVKERVTRWFNPNHPEIRNQESLIVHNFAWAAQIAWEVGLRYYRLNDNGEYQPAIALLCNLDYHLYPKSELFMITMTFDHVVSKENINQYDFDPSWECYHRVLTRKDQGGIVREYMKIAKQQYIDFPALPSRFENAEFGLSGAQKIYPDQSYIESIKDGIITIRDPKNDTRLKQCRMRLFDLRNS